MADHDPQGIDRRVELEEFLQLGGGPKLDKTDLIVGKQQPQEVEDGLADGVHDGLLGLEVANSDDADADVRVQPRRGDCANADIGQLDIAAALRHGTNRAAGDRERRLVAPRILIYGGVDRLAYAKLCHALLESIGL